MEGRAGVVVLGVQRYGRLRVPKYFVDPDKAGELYAATVIELSHIQGRNDTGACGTVRDLNTLTRPVGRCVSVQRACIFNQRSNY